MKTIGSYAVASRALAGNTVTLIVAITVVNDPQVRKLAISTFWTYVEPVNTITGKSPFLADLNVVAVNSIVISEQRAKGNTDEVESLLTTDNGE